jgi:hypothetical protein
VGDVHDLGHRDELAQVGGHDGGGHARGVHHDRHARELRGLGVPHGEAVDVEGAPAEQARHPVEDAGLVHDLRDQGVLHDLTSVAGLGGPADHGVEVAPRRDHGVDRLLLLDPELDEDRPLRLAGLLDGRDHVAARAHPVGRDVVGPGQLHEVGREHGVAA